MADDSAEFAVELDDDVTPGARRAGRSMERLQRIFEKFNKKTMGRALGKFASIAKDVVTIGASIGAGVAVGIGAMAVGMADFSSRSKQAFGLLAKHGETAEELFGRSIDLATDLGLNIKDTTKQIQKFRALQFSQAQAEGLIKMGSDMQALGASGEEVSRIFAQLAQIKAKGVLQTEELRTMAESGVSTELVFAALAKQLGKTEDAVKKMVSQGEISGTEALNAIGAAILVKTGTKQFGEAGKKFADSTLTGMAGRMRSKFQRLFLTIGEKIEPAVTDALGAISKELDAFFSSAKGQELVADIADALGAAAVAVKDALPFVKEFLGAFGEGAGAALKEIGGAFADVFGALAGGDGKTSVAILRAVGKALGELVVFVGAVALAVGGVATVLVTAATIVWGNMQAIGQAITNFFGGLINGILEFNADVQAWFDAHPDLGLGAKLAAAGGFIVKGLIMGIKGSLGLLWGLVSDIGGGIVANFKNVLGIASPSKVFEQLGRHSMEGFQIGFADLPTLDSPAANMNGNVAVNPGGLRGGNVYNFSPNISVTAGPGATREDGERLAAGLRDELERGFLDMLEGTALETGS